jgi:hypothetical protein
MPRLQVDLSDDLHRAVEELGLPVSELLAEALRREVQRHGLLAATDEYLAGLLADVGEPSAEAEAWAQALVDRIVAHTEAAEA